MVGKLIKNELKAGLHYVAPIYIATVAVAAILAISFLFEIVIVYLDPENDTTTKACDGVGDEHRPYDAWAVQQAL